MKLCKDCKHLGKSVFGTLNTCNRPTGIDPISGDILALGKYCIVQRTSGWLTARMFGDCGKEARYFEAKELGD